MEKIKFAQKNPSSNNQLHELNYPVFLLNFPLYFKVSNNIWMEESKNKIIDKSLAQQQWLDIYEIFTTHSIVYLLPSKNNLQDQTYAANLGVVLPGSIQKSTTILSNFRSSPRVGEVEIGRNFFSLMGYNVIQSPYFFEGEAELKYLRDNIFIGGYNIRTEKLFHEWMEKTFSIKILKVRMHDPYLYHVDTLIFPLNKENIIASVGHINRKTIKKIEKYANIISIKKDDAYGGTTNSVILGGMLLNASPICSLSKSNKRYISEIKRINNLTKIAANFGLEPVFINLSEFEKSGALLSCLVMHLTYPDK